MNIYIAYRDLEQNFMENSMMGRQPMNLDFRFTNVKDGIYLITSGNQNYAVTRERGEQFTNDVLAKCTGKHQGLFPLMRELNGKKTAAVVEIHKEREYAYYDMDDEVLLNMLNALKEESGEPLTERELINHCYPNPPLPEGDFELDSIYHQLYFKPVYPATTAMMPPGPDKRSSFLWINQESIRVEVIENDIKSKFEVPAGLIPEIKEKARELCKEPAEAYVEDGNWESFVKFGKPGERIFTDPDKTFSLLKEIASKSTLIEQNNCPSQNMAPSPFAAQGFFQLGMINQVPPAPAPAKPAGEDVCPVCGEHHNGGKYCCNCGTLLK